jgi:1-acyl-sn-glycerol-3-phosphate acyltransferase
MMWARPLKLRSRGFPWTKPAWPDGVPQPPAERKTGVDFDTEWARRYPARLARAVVQDNLTRPLIHLIADPTVSGLDRIADVDGPVIFAANHASHVDTPLLLTCLPERFRHRTVVAAGADYFFDKVWKGRLWAFLINAIPIERTRVNRRSADEAAALINEGWNLIIFPEGGRSPDGWGQPHRAGAAFLSVRGQVPIVPVYLEGTRRILRKGGGRLQPSSTRVTFGAALRPADGEDTRELAARLERALAILADEATSGWWVARRRAAQDRTPDPTGPQGGAWRRAWALPTRRTSRVPRASGSATARRWPAK